MLDQGEARLPIQSGRAVTLGVKGKKADAVSSIKALEDENVGIQQVAVLRGCHEDQDSVIGAANFSMRAADSAWRAVACVPR